MKIAKDNDVDTATQCCLLETTHSLPLAYRVSLDYMMADLSYRPHFAFDNYI